MVCELESLLKEVIMACFMALSWHFYRENEKSLTQGSHPTGRNIKESCFGSSIIYTL
jgi:hypothetical protein